MHNNSKKPGYSTSPKAACAVTGARQWSPQQIWAASRAASLQTAALLQRARAREPDMVKPPESLQTAALLQQGAAWEPDMLQHNGSHQSASLFQQGTAREPDMLQHSASQGTAARLQQGRAQESDILQHLGSQGTAALLQQGKALEPDKLKHSGSSSSSDGGIAAFRGDQPVASAHVPYSVANLLQPSSSLPVPQSVQKLMQQYFGSDFSQLSAQHWQTLLHMHQVRPVRP